MLMIVFGAGCLLLSVLFHAASLLHLGLPLLYALIVPTLFSGLKKLEKSGFLIKEGSRNAPVYFLAEE